MNLPDDNLLTRTLTDVGERVIKTRIIKRLQQNPAVTHDLFGGLGHDSGIVRPIFDAEELLLVNTDKSGVSKAYTLGLAGGECIGYFAISHAVSDILASGGTPFATSIAMLLPG